MRYSFSWIQLKVNLKVRSGATHIERLLGQFVTQDSQFAGCNLHIFN